MFEEVVDVSAGLSNPTRILYSKVAKKATFLDDFLARRLQLKSLEERRIELKTGIKQTPEPIPTTAKKSETNGAEEGFESMTSITSDMPQTPEDKERDLKKWLDQAKKNIWNSLIPKLNGEINFKSSWIWCVRISSVKFEKIRENAACKTCFNYLTFW